MTNVEVIVVGDALKPFITCHAESDGRAFCTRCQDRRYNAARRVLSALKELADHAQGDADAD